MTLRWVIGTVVALVASAQADAPGWSRGQQELPITWEECVKRANGALSAESYRIDQPSPFAVGVKGQHTALVMCNPSPNGKTWVNIVVASNGEGGGSERQRLQARMEGQAPTAPPVPPPVAGEGSCAGASYSLALPPTSPQQYTKLKISFTSKGKMKPGDWIGIARAGDPPDRYWDGKWVYTKDAAASCTWEVPAPVAGNYQVAYFAEGVNGPVAVVPMTVMSGAPNRIEPPVAPQATVQYLGCFKDSNNPFDLDGYLERSGQNTPQRCIATCAAKSFKYAGVQYGQSCVCGNRYGTQGLANNCTMACTGDSKTSCGGANANGVYTTGR